MLMTILITGTKKILKSGRMSLKWRPVISLLVFLVVGFLTSSTNKDPCIEQAGALFLGLGAALFSGVATSMISRGSNELSNAVFGDPADKAMDQQKELMDYQYDQQKDFFNLQNEYNTPANQLDRFEQAGVNPNLAMNFGLGSAGNAAYQLPNPNQMRVGADFKKLMSESQNMDIDSMLKAELAKSESSTRDLKIEKMILENGHQDLLNQWQKTANDIQDRFGHSKAQKELRVMDSIYYKNFYDAYEAAQRGDGEAIDNWYKDANNTLDYFSKLLGYSFDAQTFKNRVDMVYEGLRKIKAEVKTEQGKPAVQSSEVSRNRASAKESMSHANLYDKQAYGQDLANAIQEVYKEATQTNKQAVIDQMGSFLSANDKKNLFDDQEYQRLIETMNKAEGDEYFKALDRLWIYLKKRVPDVNLPILITPFK